MRKDAGIRHGQIARIKVKPSQGVASEELLRILQIVAVVEGLVAVVEGAHRVLIVGP